MSSRSFEETSLSLLELVLRLQGNFRRSLKPIGVTPLQAGVLCYLKRHPNSRLPPIAEVLSVEAPTVVDVVKDLVRKRWVSNQRSVKDRRALCLRLTRKGETLVGKIALLIGNVNAASIE